MPFTGDSRRSSRSAPGSVRASGLSTWLSTTSGSPTSGSENATFSPSSPPPSSMSGKEPATNVSPTRLQRTMTLSSGSPTPSARPPMPAPSSRLAFLTTSISTAVSRFTQPTPLSSTIEDEILGMDIERALFPSGAPPDAFSPAAFKNLQQAATATLTKAQAAYRQRSALLHELQEEGGALRDELDESRTRVEHLRLQLEGMARRDTEREQEMAALREELDRERRARMMSERRLAEVQMMRDRGAEKDLPQPPDGSVESEDLGVDEEQKLQRRWRKSNGSYDTDEEESINGDAESSVFSRSRSPTIIHGGGYEGGGVAHPRVSALGIQNIPSAMAAPGATSGASGRQRPPLSPAGQPMTTFQKLVKGVTGTRREDGVEGLPGARAGADGCQNCLGQDTNFAWNTVGLLRDENRHLKNRVEELEAAVDGALDLAHGVGLDLVQDM